MQLLELVLKILFMPENLPINCVRAIIREIVGIFQHLGLVLGQRIGTNEIRVPSSRKLIFSCKDYKSGLLTVEPVFDRVLSYTWKRQNPQGMACIVQ